MRKKYKGFSKEQKYLIKKRDNNECFFCENKKNLTVAHIFVWRKDGGKPVEENGLTLCEECHQQMDFGIGITVEQQIDMLKQCKQYLLLYYKKEIKEENLKILSKKRRN